jgi:ADP-heptose:LPS heptosyltransferase
LEQSASVLKHAQAVITPDTGMMHIASALQTPVISIWGNTVPEFGMYPYIPMQKEIVHNVEVKELGCRPCSKIGHPQCPKKHFNCINNIDVEEVVGYVKQYI